MSPSADPEEEAWRAIVENYGERAHLGPEDLATDEHTDEVDDLEDDPDGHLEDVVDDEHPDPGSDPGPDPGETGAGGSMPRASVDHEAAEVADDRADVEEHYVPPSPPPVPIPRGPRGLAWLGMFGAPTLALLLIVLHVGIPGLLGVALLGAFLGGFGYLVATMRKDAGDDGWDDGAVV